MEICSKRDAVVSLLSIVSMFTLIIPALLVFGRVELMSMYRALQISAGLFLGSCLFHMGVVILWNNIEQSDFDPLIVVLDHVNFKPFVCMILAIISTCSCFLAAISCYLSAQPQSEHFMRLN